MTHQNVKPYPRRYSRIARLAAIIVSGAVLYACAIDASDVSDNQSAELSAQETGRARVLFLQCRACHAVAGEENTGKLGPTLAGVFDRKAGTQANYGGYSAALKNAPIIWNTATMDAWLADPGQFIPGNLMAFAGIEDAASRALLIRYLQRVTEESVE